ncbi:MAG: hypothetical protein KQI35_03990 [Bacteroidetes bacterium]|nr:hypothetical protein [Bacteroidota bacterium]
MKTYKFPILMFALILGANISMASNEGDKVDKLKSENESEVTNQALSDNVMEPNDEAIDVVVLEATNNPVGSIPLDTKNSISEKLTYPKFAQDDQRTDVVVVSFTYTEEGFLKVLSLNSSDEELNPYIISKLENIRLKNGTVTIGKEYYAKFQFKLL